MVSPLSKTISLFMSFFLTQQAVKLGFNPPFKGENFPIEGKLISLHFCKKAIWAKIYQQVMLNSGFEEQSQINEDLFSHVEQAPEDSILGVAVAFNKDQDPKKVNLSVGAYRDENGKPYVFKVVEKVQKEIHAQKMNHEYLDIDGHQEFIKGTRKLVFGDDSSIVKEEKIATVQSLSGAGALRIGLEFLFGFLKRNIYVSKPSWPIHQKMSEKIGFKCSQYPYYSSELKGLDFQNMLSFFKGIQKGSIVILHASAHNPTGIDPTQDQWKSICDILRERQALPIFDLAYQGYATGDLDNDCWAVRHFVAQGFQMLVTQSFAKNLGMYGERVGALHIVAQSRAVALKILSQLKILVRLNYSNPSRYGAEIVSRVINSKANMQEWKRQLSEVVARRIIQNRSLLRAELERINTPGTWSHITEQIGMFSYTGIKEAACEILTKKYHVYLLKTGRISMAGINQNNILYIAESIKAALLEAQ